MITFNKSDIREELNIENIFSLLEAWGGDPEYTEFGILASTICHNRPGEGSKKLYYYSNTDLFKCYTGCDATFDIFELVIKVAAIQQNKEYDLNDAVRYIAYKFGIAGSQEDDKSDQIEDWAYLANYDRIQSVDIKQNVSVILKEYDKKILDNLNYDIKLVPWTNEHISKEVLQEAKIGFFPGADQITIPHYDQNGRFIGLRGRSLIQEEAEKYGKYRPVTINKLQYTHPLGMNLYNLNLSQQTIKAMKVAIVFEGEKSTLLYRTYFGAENDISVACCGSNVSAHQIQLLLDCNINEIVIAFDRQFQKIGDNEFNHLTKNLTKLYNRYKNYVKISFIFDKNMITNYKDSPIDCGKDIFLRLFKERIYL